MIMNISPDASPISTPSSGSPPPEEIGVNYQQLSSATGNLLSFVTSSLSPSSKRRMPGAPVVREPKTRRTREDVRRSGAGAPGGWDSKEGGAGKRDKEDMVDYPLVEFLRKEIGDPFKDN